MIERGFVAQKTKEYYIKRYVESKLARSGISSIKLKKIPLGEKIIISTSRPSLIVGSRGSNIRELTKDLKREFNLENPQIEINEIKEVFLDPAIVAEKIATSMERFGSARFKSIGHKIMENIIKSGALGVEIVISGKIPSSRAKSWRFNLGYLKKSGDASLEGVRKFKTSALLKSGVVGIKVSIMPPDLVLPDRIQLREELPGQEVSISEEKRETEEKSKRKKPAGTRLKPSSLKSPPKTARKPRKEKSSDKSSERPAEEPAIAPEKTRTEEIPETEIAGIENKIETETGIETESKTENGAENGPEDAGENKAGNETETENKTAGEQE